MRKVIFREENGISEVIGFRKALIDPLLSRDKIKKEVSKMKEYEDVCQASAEHAKALSKKPASKSEQLETLTKLKSKKSKFDKKLALVTEELIEYFPEKKGEKIISEEKCLQMKKLLAICKKNGTVLTLDKREIEDKRGSLYYLEVDGKLVYKTLKLLGETYPADAIITLTKDLEERFFREQEELRIFKMTQDQRDVEYKAKEKELFSWCKDRILELEIGGMTESDAKTQAIGEYSDKQELLKTKYLQ